MRGLILALLPLSLLGACAKPGDLPPDPALAHVRISYLHADPVLIQARGERLGLARSGNRTLAFSELTRATRSCIVTLPHAYSVGEELYRRLRAHEDRHCHGERHAASHFHDEPPWE